jgi:hypothetical protein
LIFDKKSKQQALEKQTNVIKNGGGFKISLDEPKPSSKVTYELDQSPEKDSPSASPKNRSPRTDDDE